MALPPVPFSWPTCIHPGPFSWPLASSLTPFSWPLALRGVVLRVVLVPLYESLEVSF